MSLSLEDIKAAAGRLKGQAIETPLLEFEALNDRIGLRVLLKAETLQRVGAFKFRGAYNRLVQLTPDERDRGVVAFSSGNHAQGVALAARLLGIPALIVMPRDAPAVKVAATQGYGAEVRFYDRLTESREAIAAEIAAQRGSVVVPAFDDLHIMAGQGTVGLEMVHQARGLGVELDLVAAPISGGGLLAGLATAVQGLSPDTAMVGVEPEGFDDTRESPFPGVLTFPILKQRLADVALVSDREVSDAMRFGFSALKLVIEPGGAAALAALLAGKIDVSGRKVVALVLSGGNVDPEQFAQVLRGEL